MKFSKSVIVIIACIIGFVSSAAFSADYQLGSCSVTQAATGKDNVCVPYRGKTATGLEKGSSHEACTSAKANARTNLLTGIPAECGAFIDCGGPCRTIQK
mgnify:CR=1 FL=1